MQSLCSCPSRPPQMPAALVALTLMDEQAWPALLYHGPRVIYLQSLQCPQSSPQVQAAPAQVPHPRPIYSRRDPKSSLCHSARTEPGELRSAAGRSGCPLPQRQLLVSPTYTLRLPGAVPFVVFGALKPGSHCPFTRDPCFGSLPVGGAPNASGRFQEHCSWEVRGPH